jgi:hypothetical protein
MKTFKSGPKTYVYIGAPNNQYIAIENAFANAFTDLSIVAREQFATTGSIRIFTKGASKHIIRWLYQYIMAGEKNPGPDQLFEEFTWKQLITIYRICQDLKYPGMIEKIERFIAYLIWQDGLPEIENVETIVSSGLAMVMIVVNHIVDHLVSELDDLRAPSARGIKL